jgi:4-hydroxy-tetrahydrodipicolinate reductase
LEVDSVIKLAVAGASGRMGRTVIELAQADERFNVVAALTTPDDPLLGRQASPGARVTLAAELPQTGKREQALVPCEVLIDFTLAQGTMRWLAECERLRVPMVIGATGHTHQQLEKIAEAAHTIPIVKATNFSSGIQAILDCVRVLVAELGTPYDVEIVETHHRHKLDAPSGTALTIAEALRAAREQAPNFAGFAAAEPDGDRLARRGDVGRPHEPTQDECESTAAQRTQPRTKMSFGRHGRTAERGAGEIGIHAVRMGDVVGQHEIHFCGCGETITLKHVSHSRETFAAGALRAAAWVASKQPGLYSMKDVLGGA